MLLNEEQSQIRDMARAFARDRLAPGAGARSAAHASPPQALSEMGDLGFLGMLTPEEYGGSDVGAVGLRAGVLEEIAAGDGPCSTI